VLLCFLHFNGDFVDLACEAGFVTTDADSFDNGRLIVEADICGLIGKED